MESMAKKKYLFDLSKVTIILTTNAKYYFLKMSTSINLFYFIYQFI